MARHSQEMKTRLSYNKNSTIHEHGTLMVAKPTSQVNGDRKWAEERGRFAIELEVLITLAPGL